MERGPTASGSEGNLKCFFAMRVLHDARGKTWNNMLWISQKKVNEEKPRLSTCNRLENSALMTAPIEEDMPRAPCMADWLDHVASFVDFFLFVHRTRLRVGVDGVLQPRCVAQPPPLVA